MSRARPSDHVRVLVVDDEPDFAEMTAAFLERHDASFATETATSVADALDRLAADPGIDCVVSDYDMPGRTGLEFLDRLHEAHPEIPFILFTGKGSEEIASRAISAGVTDYLQKRGDTEQFERLANRIAHATTAKRAEREAAEIDAQLRTIVGSATDAIITIDTDSTIQFANAAVEAIFGYSPSEVEGEPLTVLMPERYRDRHLEGFSRYLDEGSRQLDWTGVELPGLHRDGHELPLSISFGEFTRDGERFFIGIIRDVSEVAELRSDLEATLDRVTDAFFALDDDWRFTYVNDRAEELLDRPRGDLLGTVIWDVFAGGDESPFRDHYERAMGEQEPVAFEEFYPPLDTWFDVRAYPSESGLSVYFRDVTRRRRRVDRLAGLNETVSEFLGADTREALCEIAIEAAADRLDLPVSTIALIGDRGRLEATTRTPDAAESLDEAALFSNDGVAWEAFTDDEAIGIDLGEQPFADSALAGDEMRVYPLGRHGVFATVIDPEGGPRADFIETVVGNLTGALNRASREERLRERESLLEEQNEWLDRLNRINDVIRRIDRVLVGATSREEIERTVCEELVADGPYRFAWIGEIDPATDRIEPRVFAGDGADYLDEASVSVDDDAGDEHPAVAAAGSREPAVVDDILVDPPLADWRKAALDRDYRSCMSIPLLYRDRLFGTLTVYADRPEAFDDLARGVLGEFGGTIGHALNSIQSTRALVSDSVVELEFEIVPADFPLLEPFGSIPDCEIELESITPTQEGAYRVFLTVANGHGEFLDAIGQSPVVEDCDLIVDRGDVAVVECLVSPGSVIAWLLDHGAIPRSLSVGERSHLQVDLPGQADVRGFVELIQDVYPGSDLVAKRERERSPLGRTSFLSELDDRLTARQHEILVTAYHSGFFDTPRERTGEEVASSLGISQPTFSDHLRAAMRKLLGLLYDDESASPRRLPPEE